MRENDLITIENFLENKEEMLDVKEEPFEKLMFFYKSALNQLITQMNIIKDEFQIMYNYDLIDHIDTRIKEPKSIVKKMEKKKPIISIMYVIIRNAIMKLEARQSVIQPVFRQCAER